jgi:hypothetical protein
MIAGVFNRIRSRMRAVLVCVRFLLYASALTLPLNSWGQPYPSVEPIRRTFMVADVDSANVSLDIRSASGAAIYHLQCHSGSYADDPDFVYSGDFECRLSMIGQPDSYSTLLTEDARQSKDWESRGRFFAAQLQGSCAGIPEFGSNRNFKLRGMDLGLRITAPTFAEAGKLKSLRLTVTVRPDPVARRAIATIVPQPPVGTVPGSCEIRKDFVDYSALGKSH